MISRKLAILFALLSTFLWAAAFLQRGRFSMQGYHSIYEPALLNFLVIANIPAAGVATLVSALLSWIGVDMDPQGPVLLAVWIAASALQWALIGH